MDNLTAWLRQTGCFPISYGLTLLLIRISLYDHKLHTALLQTITRLLVPKRNSVCYLASPHRSSVMPPFAAFISEAQARGFEVSSHLNYTERLSQRHTELLRTNSTSYSPIDHYPYLLVLTTKSDDAAFYHNHGIYEASSSGDGGRLG